MKINDLVKILDANVVNLADGERDITTGYCGDFLSFVMGKAPSDCAWFTVMTNVNICAVATLAEVGVIVVCENSKCMDELVEKAKMQNVNLIETKYDIFNAVKLFIENDK